ncbi:TetR/AcrR family transcriptional regulator [Noviherbaspirillum sp.]|jgi:AcrR family transcriptional regulator|uniref:TetR/AcrR family transcriptional regulator n=1 Tax=Noviherbaspirillum sp. TaxID=1926288 RepID=UPI002FE11618
MNQPKSSVGKPRVDTTDRELILTAAARLFRENGYERTTVRQIADACGLLPGSLHYRYPAKEAILLDMMKAAIEQTIRAIIDATAPVADPLHKLRAAMQAHIRVLLSGNDMFYVLLFEWRSLNGEARAAMIAERDRYERYWAILLDTLKVQGYIRQEVDLHMLRLIGLGALNWVATWYREGGRYTEEQIGDMAWTVLTQGALLVTHHNQASHM